MRKSILISTFIAATLTACGGTTEPPSIPPSDVTTYPALAEGGYASTTVTGDYPMALTDLRAWLSDGNKIVAEMESTDNIAKPVETVYLTGNWPEDGATRRVKLEDDHFVLERVVSNTPASFQYQIWNLTAPAGKSVDHIHGIQAFEALDDEITRLTWTYKVKPDAGFKKPFVQRFVNNDVTPFLSMAVENTVALANEAVTQME